MFYRNMVLPSIRGIFIPLFILIVLLDLEFPLLRSILQLPSLLAKSGSGPFPGQDLPILKKVVQSEIIVVGKIQHLENDLLLLKAYSEAKENTPFQIATLKVEKNLLGLKNETHLRIGWPININIGRRVLSPGPFTIGQKGCFFLVKYPDQDFYFAQQLTSPLRDDSPSYKEDIEEIKKIVKVLNEPSKALAAKTAAERSQAINILLNKYSSEPQQLPKGKKLVRKPIDPAESKLILTILAEMEWKVKNENILALELFYKLGVEGEIHWAEPKFTTVEEYRNKMKLISKKWLQENKESYRIKKWVVE